MDDVRARLDRIERLLVAARPLARPDHPQGRQLRARLLETSGLSAPSIELGVTRCLELTPTTRELESLLESTPEAPRAHVLLAGNVFVAALRAIAIGVASSTKVHVRTSRRDPALAELLHAAAPDLFELTPALNPAPGDHVWAYGSDATLAEVRASLPRGVWLHEHGSGFGAIAVAVGARDFAEDQARAIALDAALFDGHGCLSPRVVCVLANADADANLGAGASANTSIDASASTARGVARALAQALRELERELPPGPRTAEEAAQARRSRDAATYAFEVFDAGSSWVTCSSTVVIPASGRNLHVVATADPRAALAPWSGALTCIACNDGALRTTLARSFPGARLTTLGAMQQPPLDGPVDRRRRPLGDLL